LQTVYKSGGKMPSQRDNGLVALSAGRHVRIRQSQRAPYAGSIGMIAGIDESDSKGPYLVRFEDGTQFRYKAAEVEPAQASQPHSRIISWEEL
jgi:hypothetical protein